ncbi:tryptophan-rich sensory protein TspO [Roseovarius atlanticus]|uniref:tryptophan-rich sensory protein TspO n=1 Tax=Roseovarius atlanticus TaxID=1641875 RepID=UPI001C94E40A|nr:TspO/MBR family protein [Roseovarius atlanticus]MBY5990452.1 tryptophan-rich sensory protein [Roseovarius atlanticus]MBY6126998.1 tryptophan-rich sensory protein [Roseovarius atlanticus]MBY6151491.1 tryptophan-rich sensory protein [Roseovarius atlanticus]
MIWLCFAIFLATCFAAGATGALFPPGKWYEDLNKPTWTPPNWLFPVAWTTLYLLMAGAGARAAVSPDNSVAMALWALQIALNGLWTPVFFGLRRIRLGLVVLVFLWIAVFWGTIELWQVDWLAGLMFVPYLAWVSVAGALNMSVMRLNPEVVRAEARR